jgi:hypothetical protein
MFVIIKKVLNLKFFGLEMKSTLAQYLKCREGILFLTKFLSKIKQNTWLGLNCMKINAFIVGHWRKDYATF